MVTKCKSRAMPGGNIMFKCSICSRFNVKASEGEAKVCTLGLAQLMKAKTVCRELEARGIDFVGSPVEAKTREGI